MKRSTRQRDAIASVLGASDRPLSASEIHRAARRTVRALGVATVYRTLKLLLEEDFVCLVNVPGDSPRYELAELDHHHHFQCNGCRRVYDIAGCPGNMRSLAPPGFKVQAHELVLYGECAACRQADA